MSVPLHLLASVPLAADAATVAARLRDEPQSVVAATAASLTSVPAVGQEWRRIPDHLPSTDAHPTEDGELGSLVVTWAGDSVATAWPSMSVTLMAVPQPDGTSRLALLSPTTPHRGAPSQRLGRVEGERVRRLALRRFLRHVAATVAGPDADLSPSVPAARSADRDARFLHAALPVALEPTVAAARLHETALAHAEAATRSAIADSADALADGRFRSAPDPRIEVRAGHLGGVATTDLIWSDDEEATGWPGLTLSLLVEPAAEGARLLAVSQREPRYDPSVNRVDKQARDRILREAGAAAVAALADRLVDEAPAHLAGAAGPR